MTRPCLWAIGLGLLLTRFLLLIRIGSCQLSVVSPRRRPTACRPSGRTRKYGHSQSPFLERNNPCT